MRSPRRLPVCVKVCVVLTFEIVCRCKYYSTGRRRRSLPTAEARIAAADELAVHELKVMSADGAGADGKLAMTPGAGRKVGCATGRGLAAV